MNKVEVLYARFLAPGVMFAEEWTRPVETLDPMAVEWPKNAYAFTLHRRQDVVDGDKTFNGEPEQVGPVYYHPDSYVQSLDEARTNPEATPTLIRNMECNDWTQIVWSRWGGWPQPFDAEKAVVLPK